MMDIIEHAVGGFNLVFSLSSLATIFGAAAFGVLVGAIPGLTATMAVALLVPVTFFMDPIPAIAAMVTTAAVTIFAGDIPGAYLRIPGTPASAAYVDDAYALSKMGRANECLGVNLICSTIGGLFGAILLIAIAPSLAEFALNFSSFEYFWLALLGLSAAVFISSASILKALLSLALGLLLTTVGLDSIVAVPRFTMGLTDLLGGINFIPVMIGLFAVNEVLMSFSKTEVIHHQVVQDNSRVLKDVPAALKAHWRVLMQGSALGSIVGAIPGAGADIAAWMSYALSKKLSKNPDVYGKGSMEAIVASSASNNAAVSSAWVPALVFGIPGDSITAIVIGVLYMKGMNPGPATLINGGAMTYGLFIVFIIANLVMVPIGYLGIRIGRVFIVTPQRIIMPLVLIFCIVGSFAINNSYTDIIIMLICGVAATGLGSAGFPMAPVILGLVLGHLLERSFLISMMYAEGNFLEFFSRPISAVLGGLVISIWTIPIVFKLIRRYHTTG